MNRVLVENKEKFPIDVILLIDMSTSMHEKVVGTDESRLDVTYRFENTDAGVQLPQEAVNI